MNLVQVVYFEHFMFESARAFNFGTPNALFRASRRTGGHTLRITINQGEQDAVIKLEGKITGPWAEELSRAWKEQAPLLATRKLSLDLRDITYSDAKGKRALRDIYAQTGATLLTSNPWNNFLAEEVMRGSAQSNDEEK